MTPERRFWAYLKQKMGTRWHAQRHEDGICGGIPDVSYSINGQSGWLELKVIPKWPKHSNTVIKIPHFKPSQRVWLFNRGCYGQTWLFIRAEKEYMLFDGRDVAEIGKSLNKEELLKKSTVSWEKSVCVKELEELLSRPYIYRDLQRFRGKNNVY